LRTHSKRKNWSSKIATSPSRSSVTGGRARLAGHLRGPDELLVGSGIGVAGDEHHGWPGWRRRLDRPVDRRAVQVRHAHVADHEVVGLLREALEGGATPIRAVYFISFICQHGPEYLTQFGLIIDHKAPGQEGTGRAQGTPSVDGPRRAAPRA
jgi:hypothetical protein